MNEIKKHRKFLTDCSDFYVENPEALKMLNEAAEIYKELMNDDRGFTVEG